MCLPSDEEEGSSDECSGDSIHEKNTANSTFRCACGKCFEFQSTTVHMQMCFHAALEACEKDSNRTSGNVGGNLGPLRVKGVVT